MSFRATIQADILDAALAPVEALVDECKIHVEESGMEIAAVDPANVAMVELDLDASAFAAYDADGGVLGVNLERLLDVVLLADSDDMISFELDEETRKINVSAASLEYTLALIDPESIRQEPELPDLDLPATYVFEAGAFDRAVRAADLCSDHISIVGADDETLKFAAEGDTDDVEVTVEGADLLSGRHGADRVASLFSLDYLQDMTAPLDTETECSLRVGDEFPMRLRYSLADGDVSVENMLAPRIQSE